MKPNNRYTALTVKDVSIGYENTKIVSNINFNVSPGELTGIIGVNGIGKSTLLRTLAGLQPVLSGTIYLNGKHLNKYKSKNLACVLSLVLTESVATKNMTVLELVTLGRQPYTNWIGKLSKNDTIKINEALELLHLEDLKLKKCYQLSDGQLQRVMIARALAQDTSVILLDEPTTHLDLFHKVQILKLLKSIAKETQKAILFTSHEIEIIIQLCDSILVLNGDKNSFGSPAKLNEIKAFETLFPTDTVSYDPKTGTFRLKK